MTKKETNNLENQEIDLFQISKKIGSFFNGIKTWLFQAIQFFIRNRIIISILLIIGTGLGVYLDQTQKDYEHQIIVEPNFKSTDYLYSKIDLLASKIAERDLVFLKSIGIKNPEEINKISIEPIIDVYEFINSSKLNFEVLQLMAQNGDLKSVVKESTTSKNYNFHNIVVSTNSFTTEKNTIQPILNYLNDNAYFSTIQKISIRNLQQELKSKEGIIVQIDGILNAFSSSNGNHQKNDKLIYYNENTQLNDIIRTKDSLTKDIGKLKLQLFNSDKTIRESAVAMNIKNTKSIQGKLKFVLPIVFIFLFIFIQIFISFYSKQLAKSQLQ
jgi:hypothetical protein|nr:hypothetical protein [uncultured Flavobacterium sp.]